MSLRLQVNLVLVGVIVAFVVALLAFELIDTRARVREDTLSANAVATHLLGDVAEWHAQSSLETVEVSLRRLGHVRSTDITLRAPDGRELYRSPPPTYKAGRYAPQWFANLVQPAPMRSELKFNDSTLTIRSDPSRAVLDGWDDTVALARFGIIALVLGSALVFWLTGRATRPFRKIAAGLEGMGSGDYRRRLPDFHVREARKIASAFNAAAQAIEENLDARREATAAKLRAEYESSLAAAVRERLEDERRRLARELHDETSQSLTAIRAMATALGRARAEDPAAVRETAGVIADIAGRLYAAVHEMIPRLDAPEFEHIDLADAIAERVDGWRREYPGVAIRAGVELPVDGLGGSYLLAAYRIVQEAVTNACRHAAATSIDIRVDHSPTALCVTVRDNGRGLAADWQRPGHYGVRSMRERAETFGGTLSVENLAEGGVRVSASLPLA